MIYNWDSFVVDGLHPHFYLGSRRGRRPIIADSFKSRLSTLPQSRDLYVLQLFFYSCLLSYISPPGARRINFQFCPRFSICCQAISPQISFIKRTLRYRGIRFPSKPCLSNSSRLGSPAKARLSLLSYCFCNLFLLLEYIIFFGQVNRFLSLPFTAGVRIHSALFGSLPRAQT